MNPLYDLDDLDDYLNGHMSPEDRAAFEAALESDPDLARRLDALRAEKGLRQLLREQYFEEQFSNWENERKKNNGPFPWLKWLLLALTVLAIVYWMWPNPSPMPATAPPSDPPPPAPAQPVVTPQDTPATPPIARKPTPTPDKNYQPLAKQYYRPGEFNSTLMGADTPTDNSRYAAALQAYNKGQYQTALQTLNMAPALEEEDARFLRAHTLYQLRKFAEAEREFRQFRTLDRSDFKYDAEWGELFSLLAQLPNEQALQRLKTLARSIAKTPGHPNADEAIQVLQQLSQR